MFSLALAACTSNTNEAENKTISSAIVSGDADISDPAVVAIGPRRVHCDDTLQPFCSGVLVASQVVLTAAHCFSGQRPGEPYEVFFGNDVTGNGETHGVTRVVTPDAYDGGNGSGDLALLFLDAPVSTSVVTIGSISESDVGKTVTMVGFGIANPDDGGGVGTKRTGTAQISSVESGELRITPSPSMSCDGDSGGPVFLDGSLIGITSYGDPGCTMFAENARVDAYQSSFITPLLDIDAGASVYALDAPPQNVCGTSCTDATQCDFGFDCPASADGTGHCTLNGLPPGDFGSLNCATDDDCASNTCARVASAPNSCFCLTPCNVAPPNLDAAPDANVSSSPPTSSGCSCRSTVNSGSSSDAFAFVFFLIGALSRKRKRSLT